MKQLSLEVRKNILQNWMQEKISVRKLAKKFYVSATVVSKSTGKSQRYAIVQEKTQGGDLSIGKRSRQFLNYFKKINQ